MRCPRCGAENKESRHQCYLCQAPLKDPFFTPTTTRGNNPVQGSVASSAGYNAPEQWHPNPPSRDLQAASPRQTRSGSWTQWTQPNTGPVMQRQSKDTLPTNAHTLASQSPMPAAPPQPSTFRSADDTAPSTPSVDALQARVQPAPPYRSSQPAMSTHTHRPQPSMPLGFGRNVPHRSRSQEELSDYLPDFDEKTVVDALDRLESKPDLQAIPASSETLDESTLLSDPKSAFHANLPPLPQAAISAPPAPMVAASPRASSTLQPPVPSPIAPMVGASPGASSTLQPPVPSPILPSVITKPTPAQPHFGEAESEASRATEIKQAQSGSAKDLPLLPKPRLPEGFVFAVKAQIPALWRRGLAGTIDLFIMLGITWVLTSMFGPKVNYTMPKGLNIVDLIVVVLPKYQTPIIWGSIAFASIYMLYTILFHSLGGKTPGKRLLGIRLVTSTGKAIGWLGSFARSIAFLLFLSLNLIGLLWIIIDREYRGLHDRVSGSIVIRDNPSYPLPSK